jgi:hypothetical protein
MRTTAAPIDGMSRPRNHLSQLTKESWIDHRISDQARREINLVSQLLGFGILTDDQFHGLVHVM